MIGRHPVPPSCPGLSRASTIFAADAKAVDGRDKHGHDAREVPAAIEDFI
jgi:hypothetical protein